MIHNPSKRVTIDKIKRWLSEEGISTKEIKDEYSDFHISSQISQTHSIDLDRIDSIIIVQNMNISNDDKRAYIHLDKTKKKEFIADLKSSLLLIGVDYGIQPDLDSRVLLS